MFAFLCPLVLGLNLDMISSRERYIPIIHHYNLFMSICRLAIPFFPMQNQFKESRRLDDNIVRLCINKEFMNNIKTLWEKNTDEAAQIERRVLALFTPQPKGMFVFSLLFKS
jgi:hypothetical protein